MLVTYEFDGEYLVTLHDDVEFSREIKPSSINDRKNQIISELADIDRQTGMSRAMREAFIVIGTSGVYINAMEARAVALRAELATL